MAKHNMGHNFYESTVYAQWRFTSARNQYEVQLNQLQIQWKVPWNVRVAILAITECDVLEKK